MGEVQTSVPILHIPLQHKRQKYLNWSISGIPRKKGICGPIWSEIQVANTFWIHSAVFSYHHHNFNRSRVEMQFLLQRVLCGFMTLDKISLFCTYALKTYSLAQRSDLSCLQYNSHGPVKPIILVQLLHPRAQLLHLHAKLLTLRHDSAFLLWPHFCHQPREPPSPSLSSCLISHSLKLS